MMDYKHKTSKKILTFNIIFFSSIGLLFLFFSFFFDNRFATIFGLSSFFIVVSVLLKILDSEKFTNLPRKKRKQFVFMIIFVSILIFLLPSIMAFIQLYPGQTDGWERPSVCDDFPEGWEDMLPDGWQDLNMTNFMSIFSGYLSPNWTDSMPLYWELMGPESFMNNYCGLDYYAGQQDLFAHIYKTLVGSPLISFCAVISVFGGFVKVIMDHPAANWLGNILIVFLPIILWLLTILGIVPTPPEVYSLYGSSTPAVLAKFVYIIMFLAVIIILMSIWFTFKYVGSMQH